MSPCALEGLKISYLETDTIQIYERGADVGGTWRVSVRRRYLRVLALIQLGYRITPTLHVF